MSAANVHVRALEKNGARLKLRLYLLKPDVPEFCTTANCVLQMLWDNADAPPRKPVAILEAISAEQRLDPKWLRLHQFDFVDTVTLAETLHYPVSPGFHPKLGQNRQTMPQATIEVVVTDSKWIAHIREGAEWDSAPFDAAY